MIPPAARISLDLFAFVIMVAAQSRKINRRTPPRSLHKMRRIMHRAEPKSKSAMRDWQHNPGCASAAAKILQTRTQPAAAVPYGAHSVGCRYKCVFCARCLKSERVMLADAKQSEPLAQNHARFTLKRNTPFSGD